MSGFRGSRQWDYREHDGKNKWFRMNDGQELIDVKHRALTVLRSFAEGAAMSADDLEGPLWALVDVSHGNEKVKSACQWFRVAAAYDDEEQRRICCIEAYGWIEKALRIYL